MLNLILNCSEYLFSLYFFNSWWDCKSVKEKIRIICTVKTVLNLILSFAIAAFMLLSRAAEEVTYYYKFTAVNLIKEANWDCCKFNIKTLIAEKIACWIIAAEEDAYYISTVKKEII